MDGGSAVIVEAEPVDDPVIRVQAEEPRFRIAGLRARRDRPNLDEAKAEPQQCVRHLPVLVETRGQSHRVREIEAESLHVKLSGVGRRFGQRHVTQRFDRKRMCILGIERPQERTRQAVEKADHKIPLQTCARANPIGMAQGLFKAATGGNGCAPGATQGYNS